MNYGVELSEYQGKIIGMYSGKFLPLHLGHINCIIQAASQVDVLFVVVGYDDEWDKQLCEGTKFEWVDHRVRERWVTQAVKDLPNVRVFSNYEERFEDWDAEWKSEIEIAIDRLKGKIGYRIDYVFSSEREYDKYFKKYFPVSKHIVLDPERNEINISATKIREEGVYTNWDMLPKSVQEFYVKRVCLCGIESTGKSTLIKILAALFNTNYVEEYGRTYYNNIGGYYDIHTKNDFIEIACGHNHLISQAVQYSNKVLFIDTDNVYTQFFMDNGYYSKDKAIEEMIKSNVNKIDLFIYIEPNNPHELDGTRIPVNENDRKYNNEKLKSLYKKYGIELEFIESSKDINAAINLVNEQLR